jgi:iron complex transport system ATP-binding protein
LSGVSFELNAGEFTAVVGPNGAGKSTLLSILAGLRRNYTGECLYLDAEVKNWQRRKMARAVSFVPQTLEVQFPFTAEQVVLMGRTPHCDGLFESERDLAAVERAMERTDTLAFRSREFRTLSGGERQRVVLASALAQEPSVLLLDEPTVFLDLKHQFALYRLLATLARDGLLVVAATHDLNLAAGYCDRVLVLHRGRIAAAGPPREALDPSTIRDVFDVAATLDNSGPRMRLHYAE